MADAPTAWWCPECGTVANGKPDVGHLDPRTWLHCSGVFEEASVLPRDLSLADLAVRLSDAGYDVNAGRLYVVLASLDQVAVILRDAGYDVEDYPRSPIEAGYLVVAAKETADG
jgi:hypothetical protein